MNFSYIKFPTNDKEQKEGSFFYVSCICQSNQIVTVLKKTNLSIQLLLHALDIRERKKATYHPVQFDDVFSVRVVWGDKGGLLDLHQGVDVLPGSPAVDHFLVRLAPIRLLRRNVLLRRVLP